MLLTRPSSWIKRGLQRWLPRPNSYALQENIVRMSANHLVVDRDGLYKEEWGKSQKIEGSRLCAWHLSLLGIHAIDYPSGQDPFFLPDLIKNQTLGIFKNKYPQARIFGISENLKDYIKDDLSNPFAVFHLLIRNPSIQLIEAIIMHASNFIVNEIDKSNLEQNQPLKEFIELGILPPHFSPLFPDEKLMGYLITLDYAHSLYILHPLAALQPLLAIREGELTHPKTVEKCHNRLRDKLIKGEIPSYGFFGERSISILQKARLLFT